MDEAVRKYYRRLMETRFEHEGSLENASIFVESTGENVGLCAAENDFMRLYVNVANNSIDDIKYIPEFCTWLSTRRWWFQVFPHFPCKKFLAHEGLNENRQGHSVLCTHGRTLALASSRNLRNFCIEEVLVS